MVRCTAADVVVLTVDNFKKTVLDSQKTWVVEVGAILRIS